MAELHAPIITSTEDVLTAALHLAAAEARTADEALDLEVPRRPNIGGVLADAERTTVNHLQDLLYVVTASGPLSFRVADALAFAAYERERSGTGADDLPLLSSAGRELLRANYVLPIVDGRRRGHECVVCGGWAPTRTGVAMAHSDHCPLARTETEEAADHAA